MNRKRTNAELTGGTGDVNPQTMVLYIPQSSFFAGGVNTSTKFPLPIPRYPGGNNRSIVMEFLHVDWHLTNPVVPTPTNGDGYTLNASLSTDPSTPSGLASVIIDSRAVSIFRQAAYTLVATAVGFDIYEPELQWADNLTDDAGHGILVATDSIFMKVSSSVTGYTTAGDLVAVITYRFKEIGLQEYIGIVQSQQ